MVEEKKEVNSLKIKNGHIEKLITFLDAPLQGPESRSRNKFVKILGKQLIFLNEERQKVLQEHSEKDDKGKPKLLDEDSRYDITPANLKKVQTELGSLFTEEFVIDILPSIEKELKVVSKLLLETKKEFNLIDGAVYDELAEVFEKIK